MNHQNPYRPPQASIVHQGSPKGIWRDGDKLVVHRQAKLPPVCVKTNQPSARAVKRKFYWHHPAVFLAILAHFLIYIVLALFIRKRHDLEVPVSAETARKRFNGIVIGWVVGLLSLAMLVGGITWALLPENRPGVAIGVVAIVVPFVTLIGAVIFGSRSACILRPKKMTESATWFVGADFDYLNRFPEIPPNA